MAAWAFISPDGREALVQGIVYRAASNVLRGRLRLAGLEREARYRVGGKVYTGQALMTGGLLLPWTWGDDMGFTFFLERIDCQ